MVSYPIAIRLYFEITQILPTPLVGLEEDNCQGGSIIMTSNNCPVSSF